MMMVNNNDECFQTYSLESVAHVQKYLMRNEVPVGLFQPYIEEIFAALRGDIFAKFIESDKYTRQVQTVQTIATHFVEKISTY